jgi:predicted transcriptional regulator of viral defense system
MPLDSLQSWIESQMMCGRYIFTKEDVINLGVHNNKDSLKKALYRAQEKGVIISPWQNFYVAVPMEYRLKGEVPPSFYIDHLMRFVSRDYYVSLLSAAILNGAGHQRPMSFQVTVRGKQIRSAVKNGTLLDFNLRKEFPLAYVNKVKVQTGYMNVSSPELTALDLVSQEEKVGGLSRVAEVLIELAERMKWDESKLALLHYFNAPIVQRLGYLLDLIEETELADCLMRLASQEGKIVRKVRLKQSKPETEDMEIDKKWKIIVNQKIETDEI